MQRSSRAAADGRAHAATVAEVWRTRLEARLTRWRTQSRLDAIAVERAPALQALGDAVWRGDMGSEHAAKERLVELEQEGKRIEDELAARLADADERIRRARLPVQETMMVTPNEPSAPYPPPDEGNPPRARPGTRAVSAARRGYAAHAGAGSRPDRERIAATGDG